MSELTVASRPQVRARIRALLASQKRWVGLGVLLSGMATGAGLIAPWLIGQLVADVTHGRDRVVPLSAAIVAALVVQAVLVKISAQVAAVAGETMLAELREELVEDALALPEATTYRLDTGDMVTRTTRDIGIVSSAVRYAVPDTFNSAIMIVGTLVALALLGPLLLLPLIPAVPPLVLVTRWYLRRARSAYLNVAATYSRLTAGLTETVEAARTVEAYQLGDRRFARAQRDIRASYGAERWTLWLRTVYLPVCDVSFVIPVFATVIVGGLFYLHGLVSLAAVTAAILYTQQLLGPIDVLLYWTNELQTAAASMARLIVVTPDSARSAPDVPPPTVSRPGHVSASDVTFAYRAGTDVVSHVDLEVSPGERLAIVGPSGAGKTTLGRLLGGIYQPDVGTIAISATPTTAWPPDQLRRMVALVTQENHIFIGTLRDNLVLGRPDATDAELIEALTAVDVWDLFAEGLDTVVGSGGTELNAAQAQQVALARLLVAGPQILILDEATAALDPASARDIERSLANVVSGRTVIAIAHRLHTAHGADRIAVMDSGRIIELGTHSELLRLGGAYAALWSTWQGTRDDSTLCPGER